MTKQEEIKMYGQTLEEVKDEPMFRDGSDWGDLMYAMAILSDAQHVMESGDKETARQWINKAKYWISNVQSDLRMKEIEKYEKQV